MGGSDNGWRRNGSGWRDAGEVAVFLQARNSRLGAASARMFRDLILDRLEVGATGIDGGGFQSVKVDTRFERRDEFRLESVEDLQDGALDGVRVLEGREGIVV